MNNSNWTVPVCLRISCSVVYLLRGNLWHTSICFVSLVWSYYSDWGKVGICAWAWVVGLLDCSVLGVSSERNCRFLFYVFAIVAPGARVKMRVWNCKIPSDISSNPISDVWLVHWVHIHFVFAGAWHVKILRSSSCLHTKAELRILTWSIIGLSWVSEIEIASDFIVSRTWNS